MSAAMIGALRVMLGLDTAQFTEGLTAAQKQLKQAADRLQSIGATMTNIGTGLTAAITLPIVAAGAAAVKGAQDQAQAMAQVRAGLESMGPVAGRTAEQLLKASDALEMRSLFDGDQILSKVTANLLTFGNVAGESFDRAQQSAVDLATRMNMDLQPATLLIGKALNDPIKGMTAMGRAGIQFSEDQKAAIKAMVETGDVAGAQSIILGELERQFGGAGAAAADTSPWRQAQVALGQVGDIIGERLLPVIRQVSEFVGRALVAFRDLNPNIQTAVIVAAALAAALGPVIVAIGAVVGSIGVILPVLAALPVVLLPIAAGVAAVVAAFFMFRDDIEPVLTRLWGVVQKTLGPSLASLFDTVSGLVRGVAEAWSGFFAGEAGQGLAKFGAIVAEVLGNVLIRTLSGAVRLVEGALKGMGIAFSILGDLLTGDFSGAWRGMKDLVVNAVQTVGNVVAAIFPEAADWARKLAEGVTKWLVGKLGEAMAFVVRKAREVGDAFFTLYDRVVGNSYVPDMVDGIAAEIGRLQSVMVAPIVAATAESAARFEAMGDDVRRVIDGLLTDRERLDKAFAADTGALEAARKAGEITQGEFDEFSRRNRERYAADRQALPNPLRDAMGGAGAGFMAAVGQVTERLAAASGMAADKFGVVAESIKTAFDGAERAADDFANRFADVMDAVLRGDIKGVLSSILNDLSRNLLTTLGRAVGQWGMGQGGIVGSLFSALTGFATGGSFKVGGAGGTDSQVRALRLTPGETVSIQRPGQDWGGGRAVTFDMRGAVVTEDLLRQMQTIAAGEAGKSARVVLDASRRAAPGLQQRQAMLGTT